jgi:hypothetical protein
MRTSSVALTQGLFYVLTGAWPIVHYRSFERVTGPKVDDWLVKTVGGLIAAVGTALLVGAGEPRSRVLRALGLGSAVALGVADIYYASRGRISRIYLGDAAAEAAIIALWTAASRGRYR